jgi:hypothetical protein
MKIRLKISPPVDQQHKLLQGMELESTFPPDGNENQLGTIWVIAPGTGDYVKLLKREYEVIDEESGTVAASLEAAS